MTDPYKDLVGLATGILECLDQGDVWTKPARKHAAGLLRATLTKIDNSPERPIIVCLCGSTRFWKLFQQAGLSETMAGRIVLSIGAASGTDDEHFGNLPRDEYDRIKEMLDQLHMRKIDLCDEVLILNQDQYIGESTARELAYARQLDKRVRFWEDEYPPIDPPPDDNPVRLRAAAERAAIEQSPPPEGWGLAPVEGWPV